MLARARLGCVLIIRELVGNAGNSLTAVRLPNSRARRNGGNPSLPCRLLPHPAVMIFIPVGGVAVSVAEVAKYKTTSQRRAPRGISL